MIHYAGPGWGKTAFWSHTKNPCYLLSRGETGLLTLMQNSLVRPDIPWEEVRDWKSTIQFLKDFAEQEHGYTELVIDVLNGLERLCHEEVCRTKFGGDWGEQGFMGFQRGFSTALSVWNELLMLITRIRDKGCSVIGLCHTGIGKVPNPAGTEYSKYVPDMHDKTWQMTMREADLILFGRYDVAIVGGSIEANGKQARRGKAAGYKGRIIHTESDPCWDAKNRHGLPPQIEVTSESAAEAFADFKAAFGGSNG